MAAPGPAYRCSAQTLYDVLCGPEGSIAEEGFIETVWHNLAKQGIKAKAAEKKSWARSLLFLADDLVTAGRGEVEVLVEHPMPGQPRSRADAVLAGVDPYTKTATFVVVELKQWDTPPLMKGILPWSNGIPAIPQESIRPYR